MSDPEESGNADSGDPVAGSPGLPRKWRRMAGVCGFLNVLFGTGVGILAIALFGLFLQSGGNPGSADFLSGKRVGIYGVLVLVNAWVSGLATQRFLAERSFVARRLAALSLGCCLAFAGVIFLDACFTMMQMPGGDWAALNAVYPIMAGIAIAPLCVSGLLGWRALSKLGEFARAEPAGRTGAGNAIGLIIVGANVAVGLGVVVVFAGLTRGIEDRFAARAAELSEYRRVLDLMGSREATVEELVGGLGNANANIREEALTGLAAKGTAAAPAVPALADVVRGGEEGDAERAAVLLGGIGEPALPALRELLGNEAAEVRRRAARGLGEMGTLARPAVEELSRAAEDGDDGVRAAARSALERIGGEPGVVGGRRIERVSVDADGMGSNGESRNPAISADGRVVAFYSAATNLDLDDPGSRRDVFVRDLGSGTFERIPAFDATPEAYTYSLYEPSLSSDGRYVAFASSGLKLIPQRAWKGRKPTPRDRRACSSIYVYDRESKRREWVPYPKEEIPSSARWRDPAISGDGRYVAFVGYGGEGKLFPGYRSHSYEIILYDREEKSFACASKGMDGDSGQGLSTEPTISEDGRFVAFASTQIELVVGDENGMTDIFVYDRENDAIEGIAIGGAAKNEEYLRASPAISSDGRFVAFAANAPTVVDDYPEIPGGVYTGTDIFVYDREIKSVEMITAGGRRTGGHDLAISADGRFIAFVSGADDLVPHDDNGIEDVFLHDRESGSIQLVSVADHGTQARARDKKLRWLRPAISGDGGVVVFASPAASLVEGDANGFADVFVSRMVLPEAE